MNCLRNNHTVIVIVLVRSWVEIFRDKVRLGVGNSWYHYQWRTVAERHHRRRRSITSSLKFGLSFKV